MRGDIFIAIMVSIVNTACFIFEVFYHEGWLFWDIVLSTNQFLIILSIFLWVISWRDDAITAI
jgi:hypothetical protein